MVRGLTAARLVESAYYKTVSDLEGFIEIRALGDVLCRVAEESVLLSF